MRKLFIVSVLASAVAVTVSPTAARAQQEVGRDVTVWTWDGRVNPGNWFHLNNVNGSVNIVESRDNSLSLNTRTAGPLPASGNASRTHARSASQSSARSTLR